MACSDPARGLYIPAVGWLYHGSCHDPGLSGQLVWGGGRVSLRGGGGEGSACVVGGRGGDFNESMEWWGFPRSLTSAIFTVVCGKGTLAILKLTISIYT